MKNLLKPTAEFKKQFPGITCKLYQNSLPWKDTFGKHINVKRKSKAGKEYGESYSVDWFTNVKYK